MIKTDKLKLYYSTEEVADMFNVAPSKIRFYEREFKLKIQTFGKRKSFSKNDIEKLRQIIALVDEENYTLQGAKEQLKRGNEKEFDKSAVIAKLQGIREILVRIKG
ncbi:MAG: MerR family transcriptional regulator [Cytophagales bacterium]|nr:MerR family transcriptional regulator [Cytophagales bacterium]